LKPSIQDIMRARIGLVVFPGFQALDLATLTVFEAANLIHQPAPYDVVVLSQAGGTVRSSSGIDVETYAISRRRCDTLIVAGATILQDPEPALITQLRKAARVTRRIAATCTGAFILAEAGLLNERRATTHWALARELQMRYPNIKVDEDKIYIKDGPVWTSAGMTACLDLAVALVEADLGSDLAKAVARKLVIYHRRSGGQSQFSALSELEPNSDRVREALRYAREHLQEDLSVEQLAEHVHWSPRHFSRVFQAQTGMAPAKAIEKLRLEAARAMIEDGHSSVAKIAAVTGFGDEERMRRAFVRTLGQPPKAFVHQARARQDNVYLN
jgi:transcriptional regulator GlxA family with amidase domain